MKVIRNTLKSVIEKWTDPGDYPSNAGAGPLPSEDFVESIEGEVEVELEPEDLDEEGKPLDLPRLDMPDGVAAITEWWATRNGNRMILCPAEWRDEK